MRIMVSFLLMLSLLVGMAVAQTPAKGKSHTLMGKVDEVNKDGLTVTHDKIEGYMGAMTKMPYKVDKPDVLKKVKAGDQIKATVYDNDYTLYNVEVVQGKAK